MFGRLGMGELLLILGIVLILFGPAKLPELARSIGQAFSEFKKGTREITKEFDELTKEEDKKEDK